MIRKQEMDAEYLYQVCLPVHKYCKLQTSFCCSFRLKDLLILLTYI